MIEVIFLLLFVLTILVTNLIINAVTKADVQIPDLVGMEQTEAQKTVENAKLKSLENKDNSSMAHEAIRPTSIRREPDKIKEYLTNDEQEELVALAKENKSVKIIDAKTEKPKKKTQKERTRKENPTKEMVIAKIAEMLPEFAQNVVIENKGKLITFTIGEDEFKIDLAIGWFENFSILTISFKISSLGKSPVETTFSIEK